MQMQPNATFENDLKKYSGQQLLCFVDDTFQLKVYKLQTEKTQKNSSTKKKPSV